MNRPNKERFKTCVGGQALMEGIMMRGPKKICCAVRKPDGTIEPLPLSAKGGLFVFYPGQNPGKAYSSTQM